MQTDEQDALSLENLLSSMKNLESVSKLIQQPGRQFMGPDGMEEAAVCLQRHYRGFRVRQQVRLPPAPPCPSPLCVQVYSA